MPHICYHTQQVHAKHMFLFRSFVPANILPNNCCFAVLHIRVRPGLLRRPLADVIPPPSGRLRSDGVRGRFVRHPCACPFGRGVW